ncbi:MAG: DUF169 domain-containing protein [Promethearchaeota archaeon]
MKNNNNILVNEIKSIFKLDESPICFYYTDDPPQEVFKPKRKSLKNIPCIIQLLNGVRKGNTLVLGRESRGLCPGGLTYLGFKKIMSGLEYYLSIGVPGSRKGEIILEGEKIVKTPELAKSLYDKLPFRKAPAKYAVFTPLNMIDLEKNKPQLVIFFVKMDQLAGLVQLANYDTENRSLIGISSGCGTIITEPLAEFEGEGKSRPIIGLLTDIIARSHINTDEATFTVGYERLTEMMNNIDGSFLKLNSWSVIQNRIE